MEGLNSNIFYAFHRLPTAMIYVSEFLPEIQKAFNVNNFFFAEPCGQ